MIKMILKNKLLIKLIFIYLFTFQVNAKDVKVILGEYALGNSIANVKDGKNNESYWMSNIRTSLFIIQIPKISSNFYWNLITTDNSVSKIGCDYSSFYSFSYTKFQGDNCLLGLVAPRIYINSVGSLIRYSFPLNDFSFHANFFIGTGRYSNDGIFLRANHQKINTASFSIGFKYYYFTSKDLRDIAILSELFISKRYINNSSIDITESGIRIGISIDIDNR